AHRPQPPHVLPSQPGLVYFQIRRESTSAEWQNVQRSLTLALRLNENRIAGNIQGQRVLTVTLGPQSVPIQSTLYLVPSNAGQGKRKAECRTVAGTYCPAVIRNSSFVLLSSFVPRPSSWIAGVVGSHGKRGRHPGAARATARDSAQRASRPRRTVPPRERA